VQQSIRVLLVNLPPLLRNILEHEMSQHAGWQVEAPDGVHLQAALEGPHGPDAVILGAEPGHAARDAASLLDVWPRAEVLVVTATGRAASLHELRQSSVQLGQVSASEAAETIREAVFRRRLEMGS
jgi:hypothetical protein